MAEPSQTDQVSREFKYGEIFKKLIVKILKTIIDIEIFSTSLLCVFEDSVMVVRDDENVFFISLTFLLDVISLY